MPELLPYAPGSPDWLATANPSWYPRVLAVLQRDYPKIANEVWGTAIGENAAEQNAQWREAAPLTDKQGHLPDCPCPDCLAWRMEVRGRA